MEQAITYLTSIGIILFAGILCSLIATKLKVPNVLLLLIAGIALEQLSYGGSKLIIFPQPFLTAISIVALVMIVFDSCSRLKLKMFNQMSVTALKMSFAWLFLNVTLLAAAAYFILGLDSVFIAAIFGAMVSGTASESVLPMFKGQKHKALEFLEVESIVNTPLMVILPFMIMDLMGTIGPAAVGQSIIGQAGPFLQQIITGIGAGVLVGIVVFKFMRKSYSDHISPIAIVTAALLTYIMADRLGGNGVLAVTTLGLFFGNIYIKGKWKLHEFSGMFADLLEILVFVMLGLMIALPQSTDFLAKSLALFAIFILTRFASTMIAMGGYTFKERMFITLNAPQGIALATIAFSLAAFSTDIAVIETAFAFLIYSVVLSTIMSKLSGRLLQK